MAENEQAIIKESVEGLLKELGVSGTVAVTLTDEDIAEVILETEESGMIIGYHGEVLESLQLILSLMVSKKIGRFVRISLEVGDYKKNRSEYLERLAFQTKERVLEEGRPHTLSALKAWERRVVHLLLQNDEEVVSESMGEGRDRVLVVKPRD